jgi:Na+/H+ antiporter NhaC
MLFSKQRKCERVGVHVYRGGHFNCLQLFILRVWWGGFHALFPGHLNVALYFKGTVCAFIPSTRKEFVCLFVLSFALNLSFFYVCFVVVVT